MRSNSPLGTAVLDKYAIHSCEEKEGAVLSGGCACSIDGISSGNGR